MASDMNGNNFNGYFLLSIIANMFQVLDFYLNTQQVGNDELMKHLQKQDMVLDEQTNIYLKKIIQQNEEILKEIKELEENIDGHKNI